MSYFAKLVCCAAAVGLVLASSGRARAATPACVTDTDCPGTTCGGQVCQWITMTDHECQDPGSKSRGSDGWCNTAADCKCQSVGATCNPQFSCSFTLAKDAPVSAGGAGGTSALDGGAAPGGASGNSSGGGTSSAGSAGLETGGGAGTSAPSTTNAGASNPSTPDGPITGSPSAPEAGGCAISLPKKSARVPVELGFLAAALLFLRRRTTR